MLSHSEKTTLLALARERIESELEQRSPDYPTPTPALEQPSGAFVTLHGERNQLRGCIGQIEARGSLFDVVKSMAFSAAFSDHRFRPVSLAEWRSISLEISVLSPLRKLNDCSEIQIGTHGLYMTQGRRSGLLLPQVASERSWDVETFLEQTCRKAGLEPGAYKEPHTSVYLFSAIVFDENTIT